MTVTFDAAAYKRTTRSQWEEAAEAWHRWGPTIEDWLGRRDARPCSTGPAWSTAPACSTSPPARAGRRCSPPTGRPERPRAGDRHLARHPRVRRRHGRRCRAPQRLHPGARRRAPRCRGRGVRRGDLAGRPDLLPGPAGALCAACTTRCGRVAACRRSCTRRPTATGSSRSPSGSSGGARQLPPPLPGQPGPFSLGGPGRRRGRARGRWVPRRHRRRGRVAGADGVRGRLRPVREGVLRRAAPDARRGCPRTSARRPGPRSARRSRSSRDRTGSPAPARCSW